MELPASGEEVIALTEMMMKPVMSELTFAEHFLCASLWAGCCTHITTHSPPRGKGESLKDVEKGKAFRTPGWRSIKC